MIDPTRRSHEENARHDELDLEHAMGVRRECASCLGVGRRLLRIDPGPQHELTFLQCEFCGGLGHVDPEHPLANSRLLERSFLTIDEARELYRGVG